jgi:hypothetical protein
MRSKSENLDLQALHDIEKTSLSRLCLGWYFISFEIFGAQPAAESYSLTFYEKFAHCDKECTLVHILLLHNFMFPAFTNIQLTHGTAARTYTSYGLPNILVHCLGCHARDRSCV